MDAASVMDPDPHGSTLILFVFLLVDVLVWESEAAPVVWSSFMEALGWILGNFWWKNLKLYMFRSSNPWIQIRIETNANPQHWLLRPIMTEFGEREILVVKRL